MRNQRILEGCRSSKYQRCLQNHFRLFVGLPLHRLHSVTAHMQLTQEIRIVVGIRWNPVVHCVNPFTFPICTDANCVLVSHVWFQNIVHPTIFVGEFIVIKELEINPLYVIKIRHNY